MDSAGFRRRHGVVLAGKTADEEVMLRDGRGRHSGDVCVQVAFLAEMTRIAIGCPLCLLARLPLVAPDDLPTGSLQRQTESAHSGKEFADPHPGERNRPMA